eukprot:417805-Rhodomonas_salina.1
MCPTRALSVAALTVECGVRRGRQAERMRDHAFASSAAHMSSPIFTLTVLLLLLSSFALLSLSPPTLSSFPLTLSAPPPCSSFDSKHHSPPCLSMQQAVR